MGMLTLPLLPRLCLVPPPGAAGFLVSQYKVQVGLGLLGGLLGGCGEELVSARELASCIPMDTAAPLGP